MNAISGSVQLRPELWGKGRGQRDEANELKKRGFGEEKGRDRSLNGVLAGKICYGEERNEENRMKEKAGEKYGMVKGLDPVCPIYTLPKLQIQPHNYLNHLKLPQNYHKIII